MIPDLGNGPQDAEQSRGTLWFKALTRVGSCWPASLAGGNRGRQAVRGRACNKSASQLVSKGPGWQGGVGWASRDSPAKAHEETATQGPWQMHLLG